MTKVFKFGGSSIKDVQRIKNVGEILQQYNKDTLLIVFSAMGKVTNMLEEVVEAYVLQNEKSVVALQKVKDFHLSTLKHNEYNEIHWNEVKDLNPGLYYAEVIFENRTSELIKLAIIQ